MREGRAAAAIKSDHVTIIHQVGEANGVAFLAMEFLDGCTLDDWLKEHAGKVPATASSAYVLAVRMGGRGGFVAGLVTVSTMLGLISVPAALLALGWLRAG